MHINIKELKLKLVLGEPELEMWDFSGEAEVVGEGSWRHLELIEIIIKLN